MSSQFVNLKMKNWIFSHILHWHIHTDREENTYTHVCTVTQAISISLIHIVVCYTYFCERHTLIFYRISTWHNKRHEDVLNLGEESGIGTQIVSNYHPYIHHVHVNVWTYRFTLYTVQCSICDYYDSKQKENNNENENENNSHNKWHTLASQNREVG